MKGLAAEQFDKLLDIFGRKGISLVDADVVDNVLSTEVFIDECYLWDVLTNDEEWEA